MLRYVLPSAYLAPSAYLSLALGVVGIKHVSETEAAAHRAPLSRNAPPSSHFQASVHPRVEETVAEVDGYFLRHWPFESEKARKKFVAAGFSRVTCLYYPLGLDDRIHFACRLLTLLFLIDDILEDMSFEEGSAYNEKLIPISRGDVLPDRNVPAEWITYDLWESMRAFDKELADGILEPTFEFMRSQTDKQRLEIKELGHYLEYREKDVGKALLCALMRFTMRLNLSEAEIASVVPIEQNCAKHLSVLNDIYSWEKELLQSQSGHQEGSALCSSVLVIANECQLSYAAAKNVLWTMCREWELVHSQLVQQRIEAGSCSEDLKAYMKGLEYQISGNEKWSESTLRYHTKPSAAA